MYYLQFFFTYFIIFFSLITYSIPYENIPLWTNNEYISSLPDDLSNSQIISYISSNYTKSILYLISENKDSFLYHNGKKYQYKDILGEELTFLSFPLIENKGDYYYCSSSKNIIKLDSQGNLEKIKNPNDLDKYNDYELKCFYLKNGNAIIVTFINTPYVYSYDLVESNWKNMMNLNLGEKIYDTNIYNIEDINNPYFGVLYKDQNYYKFYLYIYDFNYFQFNIVCSSSFEVNFLSKTIYSFGIQEKQVFIFTYNPKQINKYNFFQLDLGTLQITNKDGNLFLKLFKDAEIYDAYFIENSPALFYNIRRKELNGEYSFYIGVVDIESLVILYNIKMDNYKRVFYDYGYLYQNKGFLNYFEEGNQIKICPFIYDITNKICQFYINKNQFYIIQKSIDLNENENKISENCNKGKIGQYCLEQCPIGYELQNNECMQCQDDYFYNYATKKCINEPNPEYPSNGKIIYNCQEINLKYFDESCFKSCSDIYGIINPNNENECISCKDDNKIYYNGICYNNCSEIYGIINPDNENECRSCKDDNKIYFKGICYNNCSEIYGIINPDNENECKSCKDENKIFYDEICYENCSKIYGIINPDNENKCLICKDENKIFFNDTCVDKCLEGYEINNTQIDNHQTSFCQNCKELNKFYYKQKCHDNCPSQKQLSDSDNFCYFCYERYKEEKKYYQDGECLSICENGYESLFLNDEYYYCKNCKEEGKFFSHNKTCEDSCEDYSLYNETNNVCYFCNETENIYLQNHTCVERCERGYEIIEENLYCLSCYEENKFYYKGKCINECPQYLAWNITDNICVDCHEELNLYFRDIHKCDSSCGRMKLENYICIPCPEEKKFYLEYECFEKCPNYTLTITGDENYCYICPDIYQDGECVRECSKLYTEKQTKIVGQDIRICSKCGEDNNSWFDGIKCTTNCPDTTFGSDDHFCRPCFCGFSEHQLCEKFSDKCLCNSENGEVFGDNCEFFSNNKLVNKKLKIKSIGSSISTKKIIFTYELDENILDKNKIYSFSKNWKVYLNDIEVNDMKNFATGVNEDIFIINSNVLKPRQNNKVTLNLYITENNNSEKSYSFNDEIQISIQLLDEENPITITYPDFINKVMNTSFIFKFNDFGYVEKYKMNYRFLIRDECNELIPISKKKDFDYFRKQKDNTLNLILPYFKEFIIEYSNNREEKYVLPYNNIKNEIEDIQYNLEEIIKNDLMNNYSEIEKIFLIMKYLELNKNEIISDNNYELLIKFIKDKISIVANEKGYIENKQINESIRNYLNYYEPKTIFSLLNKIFLHQKQNIPDKFFISFIDIFKTFLDLLVERKNIGKFIEKLPSSDILSFFRTFDHILDIYQKKQIIEKGHIIDKKIILDILEKLSEYLVTETYPGETIRLVGKRISFFLNHFGKNQKNLSFSSVSNISEKINYDDYNSFSFDDYYLNQEKCDDDGNTLLCIQSNDFKEFKEKKLNNIGIEYYSLFLLTIENINKNTVNEGETIELRLITKENINIPKIINGIFYDIELSLNDIITQNNKLNSYISNDDEKDYSNITCIPKNYLFNNDFYCFTYFNYDKNIIKCSCNIFDEITYVSNSTLATFYKDVQSSIKIKKYKLINNISLLICFIILMIILLPACAYLYYDIRTDEKKINNNLLTFSERIKQKYLKVKILNNSSIFSFPFYVCLFKFPYLSPLRQCDFKSPKYLKHIIITLGIFYGFILSLILFLFFVPFKERENLINKRDIKNPNFEISNLDIYFNYIWRGLILSIFGVCITRIFIYIFSLILNYNKDELNYWREMKTLFTNYISNEIKGNVLLGPTWNKLRTRLIAYINICGDYILKKIKNKRNKSFENYLSTIEKNCVANNDNRLLSSFDLGDESINIDLSNSKEKSGHYRAPSIDSLNSNKSRNKSKNPLNVETINNSDSKIQKTESINSFKKELRVATTDNFQLYSRKIKIDRKIMKHNKFERIKNKYICPRKNKVLNEIEIDSVSESKSFSQETYTQLEIIHENNLSYYPREEYIQTETISVYTDNNFWTSTKINTKYNPEGYYSVIIINSILFFLLFILIIILFPLSKYLLNHFGHFIIIVWLISTIIVYILIYPLCYYIKHFIGSLLLFKCYHLKNRIIYTILIRIFVDKIMIYIFKVRNYITKYAEDLDY